MPCARCGAPSRCPYLWSLVFSATPTSLPAAEPPWTPVSLPTPTGRKLFYKLQISSGDCSHSLSVLPQMCHSLGSSKEQLTQLNESQTFPAGVSGLQGLANWASGGVPLAGELELGGLKVPSNPNNPMFL